MIEAMACGTPTIAFRQGSVPEVIDEGVSGLIVESVSEAVEAVERVKSMSRAACRNVFEERFTASRMANDYLKLYQRLLDQRSPFNESLMAELAESESETIAEDAA
jgi:glycosyltransferase involved in cell wall biosynthesis